MHKLAFLKELINQKEDTLLENYKNHVIKMALIKIKLLIKRINVLNQSINGNLITCVKMTTSIKIKKQWGMF